MKYTVSRINVQILEEKIISFMFFELNILDYHHCNSKSTPSGCTIEHDSIPVEWVLPACQPYMFRWPPLDVSTGGVGSQMDKIEQVFIDDCKVSVGCALMSGGGGRVPILMSEGRE